MKLLPPCEPRIVVVDDDDDVRSSIEWTLNNLGHSVQAFASADACLSGIDCSEPTCLVVDLLLPGMTGMQLCEKLRKQKLCMEFIVITGYGDIASAVSAMKLGALDFVEKPISRERLVQTVQLGLNNVRDRHAELGSERAVAERYETLSTREREVFQLLADGRLTKQIAQQLNISSRTVDVHRSNIMRKLKIESPTQLACVICLLRRSQSRRELAC